MLSSGWDESYCLTKYWGHKKEQSNWDGLIIAVHISSVLVNCIEWSLQLASMHERDLRVSN